jgi:GNAT superfamily N-acetyltransferase
MHETGRSTPTHIGTADHHDPADMAAVARLLEGYLRQTEEKKRSFGVEASLPDGLSARYRSEVQDPAGVFADAWILLARRPEGAAGLVVIAPVNPAIVEIKRLWTDPRARGHGIGSALMRAALLLAADSGYRQAQLTVWHWREPVLQMYRRAGFEVTASWEDRSGLVCLRRDLASA